MQFWKISTNAVPSKPCAASSTAPKPVLSTSMARAMNFAPAPTANAPGEIGVSNEPAGVDGERVPGPRRRRVLAFRQAVDLVVEQQDLEADVAAQRVQQVVAADRQAVAVAGDDPDVELGVRELEPRRDRRRAAVDRMEAVGLEVVRKARRAADARHEHGLLGHGADVGERLRHGLEHGVVAAARAPTHFLRGREIFGLQLRAHARSPRTARTAGLTPSRLRIFCTSSLIKNGWPVTLLN